MPEPREIATTTAQPNEEVVRLLAQMTGSAPSHPRFVGAPIDTAKVDALALGDLWAVARSTVRWANRQPGQDLAVATARAVLDLGGKIDPIFRGSACRDYIEFAARVAEEPAGPAEYPVVIPWKEACFALARCVDLFFDDLGIAARRLLAASDPRAFPHLALALARLVDAEFEAQVIRRLTLDLSGSPLLVAELLVIATADLPAIVSFADVACRSIDTAGATPGFGRHRLFDHEAYVAFTETGLKDAAERVRSIHAVPSAYKADKAFSLAESAVIARLARMSLDRDEPWLPPVLDSLVRHVSVAPTSARTAPSQSVTIALAQAVEAFPTPEAVTSLREQVRNIRHAGLKKKLERNLRTAERRLADRPAIALRLPLDQPISKTQATTLARGIEAGLAVGLDLEAATWGERLTRHPALRKLACSLLWVVLDTAGNRTTVLPSMDGGRPVFHDVTGSNVLAGPGCRLSLWHPAAATPEERRLWRDHIAARQIRQPFKQVFREHYIVSDEELSSTETALLEGHIVSLRPLLGLASREGWRADGNRLQRRFGRWIATLVFRNDVYPGAVGRAVVETISVGTSADMSSPQDRLGDLPPNLLSEILRAADLLVSTSGFALATEDETDIRLSQLRHLGQAPLGAMAEMRKQALDRLLRGRPEMADLTFDARHLRLGSYAIHLATARVTFDGEPITVAVPTRSNLVAVPWLPYDERLLETILCTAVEIARLREGAGR